MAATKRTIKSTSKTNKTKKASTAKRAPAAKTRTTAKKASTAKKKPTAKKTGSKVPLLDRRSDSDRRKTSDRRKQDKPVPANRRKIQRRAKVNRRRQIDPTTCERDYTSDEIEFMNALDDYKRASGRMFPTCSEVLEVLKKLGYEKRMQTQPAGQLAAEPDDCPPSFAGTKPGLR